MAKKDNSDDGWKNLNNPPRKQDPYVTGGTSSDESCGKEAAKMVAVATIAVLALRALLKGRA